MIDHAELIRRTVRVLEDIVAGEYGQRDVDMTGVKIVKAREDDSPIGEEVYRVWIQTDDDVLVEMIDEVSTLGQAMAMQAAVRIVINDWLDNDIAKENQ